MIVISLGTLAAVLGFAYILLHGSDSKEWDKGGK